MSFCPRCGAEGGFGAAGCRRCGHQFAGWAVFADLGVACAHCGHQGPGDASYCVRCGTPTPEAPFNADDTVFYRRDAFQALQATPRSGERLCVVCGHPNIAGDEFCARCETILPLGEGDTVPPRRAALPPNALPPIAQPTAPLSPSPVRLPAPTSDQDHAPTLRLSIDELRPVPPSSVLPSLPVSTAAAALAMRKAELRRAPAPPSRPEAVPVPAAPPPVIAAAPPAELDADATVHWPASAVAALRAASGQRPELDSMRDDAQETRQLTEDDFETRILDDATMAAVARRDPARRRRGLAAAALSVGALAVVATAAVAYMASRSTPAPVPAPQVERDLPALQATPLQRPATAASLPALAASKASSKTARRAASAASTSGGRARGRAASAATSQAAKDPVLQTAAMATPPPALRQTPVRAEGAVPSPQAGTSVWAACATGNGYIGEQICRVRLCQQAEHARDPICVEHRRMEAQSRRNDAP